MEHIAGRRAAIELQLVQGWGYDDKPKATT